MGTPLHVRLATLALGAAACTATDPSTTPSTRAPDTTADRAAPQSTGTPTNRAQPGVEGAVVRFTTPDTAVEVTIGADDPTTRAFVGSLPLTLELEEFQGREKIAYLPDELPTTGVPESNPEDGDLIYYAPWGNIGFYYNAVGLGHDDSVIHLGTFTASEQDLAALENTPVTVEPADNRRTR
jgi:hypothetical protein